MHTGAKDTFSGTILLKSDRLLSVEGKILLSKAKLEISYPGWNNSELD